MNHNTGFPPPETEANEPSCSYEEPETTLQNSNCGGASNNLSHGFNRTNGGLSSKTINPSWVEPGLSDKTLKLSNQFSVLLSLQNKSSHLSKLSESFQNPHGSNGFVPKSTDLNGTQSLSNGDFNSTLNNDENETMKKSTNSAYRSPPTNDKLVRNSEASLEWRKDSTSASWRDEKGLNDLNSNDGWTNVTKKRSSKKVQRGKSSGRMNCNTDARSSKTLTEDSAQHLSTETLKKNSLRESKTRDRRTGTLEWRREISKNNVNKNKGLKKNVNGSKSSNENKSQASFASTTAKTTDSNMHNKKKEVKPSNKACIPPGYKNANNHRDSKRKFHNKQKNPNSSSSQVSNNSNTQKIRYSQQKSGKRKEKVKVKVKSLRDSYKKIITRIVKNTEFESTLHFINVVEAAIWRSNNRHLYSHSAHGFSGHRILMEKVKKYCYDNHKEKLPNVEKFENFAQYNYHVNKRDSRRYVAATLVVSTKGNVLGCYTRVKVDGETKEVVQLPKGKQDHADQGDKKITAFRECHEEAGHLFTPEVFGRITDYFQVNVCGKKVYVGVVHGVDESVFRLDYKAKGETYGLTWMKPDEVSDDGPYSRLVKNIFRYGIPGDSNVVHRWYRQAHRRSRHIIRQWSDTDGQTTERWNKYYAEHKTKAAK